MLLSKMISKFVHIRDYQYVTVRKFLNYLKVSDCIREKKDKIDGYPSHVFIEPTSICDANCQLCPVGRGINTHFPRGQLSFENAKKIIDKNKDFLFSISFWNWGEPLLNKDIFKIIHYTHKSGIKTDLSTSLHPFKKSMSDALFSSGLDNLGISCHGGNSRNL